MKSMPLGTPAGGEFTSKDIKGKTLGWTGSGTQVPGQSAQEGTGGRRDQTANGGPLSNASGSGNKDYAGTQEAGTSGPTKTGGDSKFAEGGKTKMFGNRGSLAAQPGKSAP